MRVSKQLEYALYSMLEPGHYIAAISGGLDSVALFYLLCHLKRKKNFSFEVVTIDHQMRKESKLEVDFVEKICGDVNIPCFVYRLETQNVRRNIEERLRKKRYSCLLQRAEAIQAHGVLLAHHLDDQVEGLLKRFFEGGRVEGMEKTSTKQRVLFLRPFLDLRKEQLQHFLEDNQLKWMEDLSNRSADYTRNRIRHQMIPLLEKQLGKSFASNLLFFSKKTKAVDYYFSKKLKKILQITPIKEGYFADWTAHSLELIEIEYMLRFAFQRLSLLQNRFLIEDLAKQVETNAIAGPYRYQNTLIYCDRKRLFFLSQGLAWQLCEQNEEKVVKGWSSCLQGRGLFFASQKAEMILKKELPAPYKKEVQRLYSKYRVPLFLQDSVPVLFDGIKAYECLTPERGSGSCIYEISHKQVSKKQMFVTLPK